MRVSKMGMKNVKLSNLDEMYPVQDILLQTNQVKQYGSGVYAYDNVPLKVQDNIEEIIKRNFNTIFLFLCELCSYGYSPNFTIFSHGKYSLPKWP